MKTLFLQAVVLCAISQTANAQIQMGAQVSYLTGHGKSDNHTSLVGAVVYGRYSLTNNIAVGTALHVYSPKTTQYSDGKLSYSATDNVTNVSGTYDMLMGVKGSPFQPYVGIDMGISTSQRSIVYINSLKERQKHNIKQTYVMVSPKIGVNVSLGSSFGIFSQAQYNYSPGDGGPKTINLNNGKSVHTLTTEPISKYFNIDTGIYMQLSKR